MKNFLLVMLLAACSVYCDVTSSCSAKEVGCSHTLLDTAMDIISKAKCEIPTCENNTKILLKKASDCADLLQMGKNKSGVYEVWPMNRMMEGKSFFVYCDMRTDGGGWTVIQRRGDFKTPKDYFYRNWENYKEGFGNIEQDFWLGNDKIFALTNQKVYSVRFDLKDVLQEKRYAAYDKFWIDDEDRKYTLHISLYTGDAGDSMEEHNNLNFYTFDKDNKFTCARNHKGAWWYHHCKSSNLNGLYYKGKHDNKNADGIVWITWKGNDESLEWTEIKIRPKNFRPNSL